MNEKILVIDDSVTISKMLEILLTKNNYDVILAENGKKGISKVESEELDLILLDMELPDIKGWEVAKYIRAQKKFQHIPIIYLTGQSDINEAESLKTYADSFMRKPYKPETLLATIISVLRRSSYRKEMESVVKFGIGKIIIITVLTMVILSTAFFITIRIFGETTITRYAEIQLKEMLPNLNWILLGEGCIFILVIGIACAIFFYSVNTRLNKVEKLAKKVMQNE